MLLCAEILIFKMTTSAKKITKEIVLEVLTKDNKENIVKKFKFYEILFAVFNKLYGSSPFRYTKEDKHVITAHLQELKREKQVQSHNDNDYYGNTLWSVSKIKPKPDDNINNNNNWANKLFNNNKTQTVAQPNNNVQHLAQSQPSSSVLPPTTTSTAASAVTAQSVPQPLQPLPLPQPTQPQTTLPPLPQPMALEQPQIVQWLPLNTTSPFFTLYQQQQNNNLLMTKKMFEKAVQSPLLIILDLTTCMEDCIKMTDEMLYFRRYILYDENTEDLTYINQQQSSSPLDIFIQLTNTMTTNSVVTPVIHQIINMWSWNTNVSPIIQIYSTDVDGSISNVIYHLRSLFNHLVIHLIQK